MLRSTVTFAETDYLPVRTRTNIKVCLSIGRRCSLARANIRRAGRLHWPEHAVQTLCGSKWSIPQRNILLQPKGDMSGRLQALTVPVVDQNVCKKIFAHIRSDITDSMMCAGSMAGGKDTCRVGCLPFRMLPFLVLLCLERL